MMRSTPVQRRVALLALSAMASLSAAGCTSAEKSSENEASSSSGSSIDLALFGKDALVKEPTVVDCILTNGAASKCAQITVKYKPDALQVGPFCPQMIADAGGIWNWDGDKAGLYRINGEFLKMLNGQGYQFYDADGKVHITSGMGSPPKQKNTCMAMGEDKAAQMSILLPMTPQMADKTQNLGTVAKVGLALDGVPIFADAPSVLQTGHMPALDTCGGHIDPGGWYHWHATATDINSLFAAKKVKAECALGQSSSAHFAYAFDGYAMYGTTDADGKVPTDLDECYGHTGATKSKPKGEYHYHATANFPNLPACLKGVQAQNNFITTAKMGIGSARGGGGPGGGPGGPGGPGGGPNFAEAAQKLGITEQALKSALDKAGGPRADLAAVAKSLNVSEAELKAALPKPPN
jgi:YHYH protein